MSTLLGILLLVGFMIAMSKMGMGMGCCGGHSSHGRHGRQDENGSQAGQSKHSGGCCGGDQKGSVRKLHETDPPLAEKTDEKALDPICGMSVSKNSAYTKTIDGVDYYFCSKACRDEFRG